jgi:hypothetical protein
MITKQQRAALNADGFEYTPWSARNIRNCREGLRSDFANHSDYWSHLASTVVWVPDYLVIAWAEMGLDEDDFWNHLLHTWPSRDMRHINTATAFVQVFLAVVNGTARDTAGVCHG